MIRLMLPLLLALPAATSARDLRVMSVNVRLPLASDGANDWPQRRELMVRTLRDADPDVIGTQELFAIQAEDIVRALPAYAWFGRDRRGGHADEHMGIFYRRDRLRLVEAGDFWLSDTPMVVASITWGNILPRMASWGRFETRDGHRFVLVNTHFPYRDQDARARALSARLVVAQVDAIAGTDPVVLTGDFNTAPDTATHATLAAALADAWTTAPKRAGPEGTFHGFTGTPDRRIDWIFARALTPTRIRVLTTHRGARYPSDHFPVVADFAWPARR